MSPYYCPNSHFPCFGSIPMIPTSNFNEDMHPMKPYTHSIPKHQIVPTAFEKPVESTTDLDIQYTQGYLKTKIGKKVRIVFLIGTNLVQDRDGILTDVGIDYIIIKEEDTNSPLLCDIYSIKFVTFY